MAIKVGTAKAQQPEPQPQVEAPEESKVILELAFYGNYKRHGYDYEKGQAYRFSATQADVLLRENDCGRPVWKISNGPAAKVPVRPDLSKEDIREVEIDPVLSGAPQQIIELGSDEELAGLLPQDVIVGEALV
jgi:hypothetical protein